MAYPFAPALTLAEFIQRASTEFAAQVITPVIDLIGPRGSVKVRYLMRKVDGETLVAAIPSDIADTTMLVPTVIRSLCAQLKIPLVPFGFTLN